MKGQRGNVGSLPEILNFDHGSTSSTAVIDEQISWNMQNHAVNRLPDYALSPADGDISYVNTVGHEQHNISGWTMGEPSSRNTLNDVCSDDEQKPECGWSLSIGACASTGPRSEEQRYGVSSVLSLDNTIPHNLNLNAGFVGHVDDSQVMECPNLYKSNELENANDGRPGCSLDPCRASHKRKAIEENVGQSSVSGSCSYFQRTESSTWPLVPPWYNVGGSLNISAPSEQLNRRLGVGARGVASDSLPDLSVAGTAEYSHRNVRVRRNPSNQQGSNPPNLFSTGSALMHHIASSSEQSSRLLSVGHSLDFRAAPVADNTIPQHQSAIVHVPTLRQNEQSFRLGGAPISRTGGSSSAVIPGDRNVIRETARSRNLTRNMLEYPVFIPRTNSSYMVQTPTTINSSSGGNTDNPGDVGSGSTSRTGSNYGVHPSSAPTWAPHCNPSSRYPRRLSDYARRSLLSSSGPEPGGPSINYSPSGLGSPASFQEMEDSSGAGNQGNHQSSSRSASSTERQGDGLRGIPYSMRTLATTVDGRRRFVTEVRNILDHMQRGESLRLEDFMILDQSVYYGVADYHDRHRDMRLDVDNMSYEELLALEERIGNVSTGLSEESILTHLKQHKYSTITAGDETKTEPCCICQEEYNDGEDLGMLECGHDDFHADCIKQWLMHKNLCPICKTAGLVT